MCLIGWSAYPPREYMMFVVSGNVLVLQRVHLDWFCTSNRDQIQFFSWLSKYNHSPFLTVSIGDTDPHVKFRYSEAARSFPMVCERIIEILLNAYDLIVLAKQQKVRTMPCGEIDRATIWYLHYLVPRIPFWYNRPMIDSELAISQKIIAMVSDLLPDLMSATEALDVQGENKVQKDYIVPVQRNRKTRPKFNRP
ncbi:uncharacterized protein K460DRAFT_371387 [Cucurbitaria berberidis CBS 394.84]|uniref:Uncharacterized protein n=1 Tax=Cucurbitaria berberidis CBS 394.84 TaxID=1168544 RepID=A0A9P4G761_9PLEO|nr:uncharacterized protein K460DRAFT_371387 [Cucurbitaria berberidis CBS 394.84]KAF1840176.1 hypothetical protein K460DRAFT_371387 [Cucurbitaria berberidis CBS 394.84]